MKHYPEHTNSFIEERLLSYVAHALAMAIFYFIAGVITTEIFAQDNIITAVAFAPEGFALAGVLIYGLRVLPGIFLGQIMLAVYHWTDIPPAIGIGTVNMLEAFIAYRILSRIDFNPKLERFSDIVKLIAIIVFVLQPFSALLGNLCLLSFGALTSEGFIDAIHTWWVGNIMGQILFTPLLLQLYYRQGSYKIQTIAFIFILFGIYDYVLQITFGMENSSLLLLFTLPLSLYLASRNVIYGLSASVSLAVTSLYFIHLRTGTFWGDDIKNSIINLNIYILVHVIIVLIVGVLLEEKERLVDTLKNMAHFDYLTGLPNRYLLRNEIEHAVDTATKNDKRCAICYIDLDNFKFINDNYGHHVGDVLLKEISTCMKKHLYSGDSLLRIGGDEFLIILNDIDDNESVQKRLTSMIRECSQDINFEGHHISATLSIGVAFCPQHGTNVKTLMETADKMMYEAKKEGKNRIIFA
jgi:diguanylate cyclase (GGDEF)-like protein